MLTFLYSFNLFILFFFSFQIIWKDYLYFLLKWTGTLIIQLCQNRGRHTKKYLAGITVTVRMDLCSFVCLFLCLFFLLYVQSRLHKGFVAVLLLLLLLLSFSFFFLYNFNFLTKTQSTSEEGKSSLFLFCFIVVHWALKGTKKVVVNRHNNGKIKGGMHRT